MVSMLGEINDLKQVEDDYRRRWFSDNFFDLIVWYDDNGTIHGFQLCYNKFRDEHAVTWLPDRGFTHSQVDDVFAAYTFKKTTILVADGPVPFQTLEDEFAEASQNLDEEIVMFVLNKLEREINQDLQSQ